jgi:hypothetical protein
MRTVLIVGENKSMKGHLFISPHHVKNSWKWTGQESNLRDRINPDIIDTEIFLSVRHLECVQDAGLLVYGKPLFPVFQTRLYEPVEQRRRTHGPGLEFRMELSGHEEGMVRQFDHLDQAAFRIHA